MAYTLYKTNGVKLTTVEDGSLNLTTDLQLVGKNYAGYGQVVNENLVKLLENFSNSAAPAKPLAGQIWYDSLNKKIRYYTGVQWNQLPAITISTSAPSTLSNGEFWFNSSTKKLWLKYEDSLVAISGTTSASSIAGSSITAGTGIGTSQILSSINVVYDVIKLAVGDVVPVIVSPYSFKVNTTDPVVSQFSTVTSGVTLIGSDPATGISSNNNTYFWGTAADAVRLNGSLASDYVKTADISLVAGNITRLDNITYISAGTPSTTGYIDGAWQLTAGSTMQATYADIAERYEADAEYESGTVLMLGGNKEVTISNVYATTAVAGIVSTNPAYMLNSNAGNDKTHPYIALKGRVPCKIYGPVKKGDLMIASGHPGYACSVNLTQLEIHPGAVIGKALEDFHSEGFGVIEVKI